MSRISKFAMALVLVLVAGGLAGMSARAAPGTLDSPRAAPGELVVSGVAGSGTGRRRTPDPVCGRAATAAPVSPKLVSAGTSCRRALS
jgi:hypothetical protein